MKFILKSLLVCISFSLIAMIKEESYSNLVKEHAPRIISKCDTQITFFDEKHSIIELLLHAQSYDHVYAIMPVYHYIKKEFKRMGTAKDLTSIDLGLICSNKFLFLYNPDAPCDQAELHSLILGTNDPSVITDFLHFQSKQNELACISLINDMYDKTKPPPIEVFGQFSFFEPNKE